MIASAMAEGIARVGDSVHIYPANTYRRPIAEVAVFYGFEPNLRRILQEYRAVGKTVVYVDLGYWGRRTGGSLEGYHKVVVNGRHPTSYFQAYEHDDARAKPLRLAVKDWRPGGRHIIVAGMSGKAAEVEGFRPSEWESTTIAELRRLTDRPIIYRPKPNWPEAKPIAGSRFEPEADAMMRILANCHAVVTHHSNVAIDAMLEGIPAFTVEGAASALCFSDLAKIEEPWRPDGRDQFVNDLSYTQWTPDEMRAGTPWLHLRNEGLIP